MYEPDMFLKPLKKKKNLNPCGGLKKCLREISRNFFFFTVGVYIDDTLSIYLAD